MLHPDPTTTRCGPLTRTAIMSRSLTAGAIPAGVARDRRLPATVGEPALAG